MSGLGFDMWNDKSRVQFPPEPTVGTHLLNKVHTLVARPMGIGE